MEINIKLFNGKASISGDDEAIQAMSHNDGTYYVLATALLWNLGANITKDAAFIGNRGIDNDLVANAHNSIV